MNKLLQTIKENDEEFDKFNKKFFGFFPYNGEDKHHYFWSDIQSHITQSRIKELEALVEMINQMRKVKNLPRGVNKEVKEIIKSWKDGYNEAIDEFEETLQDTIKQLKTN